MTMNDDIADASVLAEALDFTTDNSSFLTTGGAEVMHRAATCLRKVGDEVNRLQRVLDRAYDILNEAPAELKATGDDSAAVRCFEALSEVINPAEAEGKTP